MKNILDVLPAEVASDPEHQSTRIASAYAAVFSGKGTRDDAEIVLVDLAIFVRYYDTTPVEASASTVAAAAHRRAVLQRILDAMTLAGEEPQGLLKAVLTAPPIDYEETTE